MSPGRREQVARGGGTWTPRRRGDVSRPVDLSCMGSVGVEHPQERAWREGEAAAIAAVSAMNRAVAALVETIGMLLDTDGWAGWVTSPEHWVQWKADVSRAPSGGPGAHRPSPPRAPRLLGAVLRGPVDGGGHGPDGRRFDAGRVRAAAGRGRRAAARIGRGAGPRLPRPRRPRGRRGDRVGPADGHAGRRARPAGGRRHRRPRRAPAAHGAARRPPPARVPPRPARRRDPRPGPGPRWGPPPRRHGPVPDLRHRDHDRGARRPAAHAHGTDTGPEAPPVARAPRSTLCPPALRRDTVVARPELGTLVAKDQWGRPIRPPAFGGTDPPPADTSTPAYRPPYGERLTEWSWN
jgi:hypothetical protein